MQLAPLSEQLSAPHYSMSYVNKALDVKSYAPFQVNTLEASLSLIYSRF
jgi:hypothetical protein